MARTRIVFQVKHNSNIEVILCFIFRFCLNFIYLFIYSWICFLFYLGHSCNYEEEINYFNHG